MNTKHGPPESVPNTRRWFRFSLRTLLVLMTVLAVWMWMWTDRVHRQEKAVARVEELGGLVSFAYELDAQDNWIKNPEHPGPAWLREAMGEHYFQRVAIVNFDVGSDPTDADLEVYRDLPDVRQISLRKRRSITDAGLVNLAGLKQLRVLALQGTLVTGPGLRHIRGCRKLELLALYNTPLTDEGLSHLADLPNLKWLMLSDTDVTDKGLSYLTQLKSLQKLELRGTHVTREGIMQIEKALPKCKILR